jgi:hypothetical protein
MSWWVSLRDKEDNIPAVENFTAGGTYALGGSTEADLNVTYNYGKEFDFKLLHKRNALETIPELEQIITRLSVFPAIAEIWRKKGGDKDYWAPTKRNVCVALMILLSWAKQHPNCSWHVN